MIYITQLIYIQEGEEQAFLEFEARALPKLGKYGGKLLLRLRPNEDSYVETNVDEEPYEIHFVSFVSEEMFQAYMKDEERKQFLHLKEQSIRKVVLIKGFKMF